MTNKEAIEILKTIELRINLDSVEGSEDALELAIQALEKQEPKKPKKYNGEYLHEDYPICPKCEESLMPNGERYCPLCGQAIDWSE